MPKRPPQQEGEIIRVRLTTAMHDRQIFMYTSKLNTIRFRIPRYLAHTGPMCGPRCNDAHIDNYLRNGQNIYGKSGHNMRIVRWIPGMRASVRTHEHACARACLRDTSLHAITMSCLIFYIHCYKKLNVNKQDTMGFVKRVAATSDMCKCASYLRSTLNVLKLLIFHTH